MVFDEVYVMTSGGPGGATEILSVLGKENSLARLQKSLANLTA